LLKYGWLRVCLSGKNPHKKANLMQIALPYYCKIEFGALSKDSITEKNSAIAADGKNYHTMF
jgi:hypothetical protein